MKKIIRYTLVLALTITASVTQADMITTQTTCMTHEQALTYMCKVNLSHHGEPATDVGISVSAVMPSMPMAHNIKPVLAMPVADVPGQYMFVLELEMKGTWRLVYNITRPFVDRLHETLMVGTGDMADQEDHSNHGDHGGHSSDHDNFKAHEMINPENGDIQKVETHERHMELMKLGYVHHGHDMTANKDSHDSHDSHEMVADD
jgi:hypothetical protein